MKNIDVDIAQNSTSYEIPKEAEKKAKKGCRLKGPEPLEKCTFRIKQSQITNNEFSLTCVLCERKWKTEVFGTFDKLEMSNNDTQSVAWLDDEGVRRPLHTVNVVTEDGPATIHMIRRSER